MTDPEVHPKVDGPVADPEEAGQRPAELMVVAGETSGDLHAAHVMEHLLDLTPGIRFCGLGGERMMAVSREGSGRVGMDSVGHSREIAVVGLVEVLRILPTAKRYFDDLVALAAERRPAAALLVDAPDFNLRLAKKLSELGIPVVYYVSPQLWAWRKGRVNKMKGMIRRMLVLFPFEVPFYEAAGVPVTHVGHPLLDVVPEMAVRENSAELGQSGDGDWILGLLPGSRDSEVRRNLPGMIEAAAKIHTAVGTKTRLLLAGSVSRKLVEGILGEFNQGLTKLESPKAQDEDFGVEIVDASDDDRRFESVRECRLCLCASGTATLEVGLLGVPMVVSYRLAALTYILAKRLVKLEHVSLVNLVLEDAVVPELIQEDADPENLKTVALDLLLDGDKRTAMLAGLGRLRGALGNRGASRKAAAAVAEVMAESGDSSLGKEIR